MNLLSSNDEYFLTVVNFYRFLQFFAHHHFFITMTLSYWLRAEVDDLLDEDTFFDSSDYSCLLEDTEWA